jgi:hypothetical protein
MLSLSPLFTVSTHAAARRYSRTRVVLPSFYFVSPLCGNRTKFELQQPPRRKLWKTTPFEQASYELWQAMKISSLQKTWPRQKSLFCYLHFFAGTCEAGPSHQIYADGTIAIFYGPVNSSSPSLIEGQHAETESIFTSDRNWANERDFFDAVGNYKCPSGMSVEDVPAVVNIKKIKHWRRDS